MLHVETLSHTMALRSGKCQPWKTAVDHHPKINSQRMREDTHVLLGNLKEQERHDSPTSHGSALLMCLPRNCWRLEMCLTLQVHLPSVQLSSLAFF